MYRNYWTILHLPNVIIIQIIEFINLLCRKHITIFLLDTVWLNFIVLLCNLYTVNMVKGYVQYCITGNFRGTKCSRMQQRRTFHEKTFASWYITECHAHYYNSTATLHVLSVGKNNGWNTRVGIRMLWRFVTREEQSWDIFPRRS